MVVSLVTQAASSRGIPGVGCVRPSVVVGSLLLLSVSALTLAIELAVTAVDELLQKG